MDSSDLLIFRLRKKEGEEGKKEREKPRPAPEATKPVQKAAPRPVPKPVPKPEPKAEQKVEPREEPKPEPKLEQKVTRMAPKPGSVENMNCISHPWRPAYAICSVCTLPFCYADIMTHNGKYYCLADIDKATMEKEVRTQRSMFTYIASAIFAVNSAVLFLLFNQQALYILNYAINSGISALISNYNYSYIISMTDTLVLLCNVIAVFVSLSKSNRAFIFSSVVIGVSMMLLSYEYLTSGTQNLLVSVVIMLFALGALAFSRMSSVSSVSDRLSVADVEWPHPGAYQ
ncbi:MAG: hypothetical protein KGH69_03760 [Candidatus Micrarchaeota archaeon]|nr:hypothetical protein [Candidatus Micrarchaeota archaeon]